LPTFGVGHCCGLVPVSVGSLVLGQTRFAPPPGTPATTPAASGGGLGHAPETGLARPTCGG